MDFIGPFILAPLKISDAMMSSCTIAEPDTGETAWVSGGTYVVGDLRIRTQTHKVYSCLVNHNGITTPPESDFTRWMEVSATNRWEMFDAMVTSQSTASNTMTVVLRPGFFNAVALYNLTGASVSVTVKDQPGGTTVFSYSADLYEPFPDWYEWLFSPYKPLTKIVLRDILPYDTAELTITVTASSAPVGIGMVCVGDMRALVASTDFGGSQYGSSVEPIDYSYIKTDDYGNTRIVKRAATTSLRVNTIMPQGDADYAIALLQEILSVPVAFIACDAEGYLGTNVFGLVSGSVEYAGPKHATASLTVKGLI